MKRQDKGYPSYTYGLAKIEFCGENGDAMYITIGDTVFYVDNSTDEQIMECWNNNEEDLIKHD